MTDFFPSQCRTTVWSFIAERSSPTTAKRRKWTSISSRSNRSTRRCTCATTNFTPKFVRSREKTFNRRIETFFRRYKRCWRTILVSVSSLWTATARCSARCKATPVKWSRNSPSICRRNTDAEVKVRCVSLDSEWKNGTITFAKWPKRPFNASSPTTKWTWPESFSPVWPISKRNFTNRTCSIRWEEKRRVVRQTFFSLAFTSESSEACRHFLRRGERVQPGDRIGRGDLGRREIYSGEEINRPVFRRSFARFGSILFRHRRNVESLGDGRRGDSDRLGKLRRHALRSSKSSNPRNESDSFAFGPRERKIAFSRQRVRRRVRARGRIAAAGMAREQLQELRWEKLRLVERTNVEFLQAPCWKSSLIKVKKVHNSCVDSVGSVAFFDTKSIFKISMWTKTPSRLTTVSEETGFRSFRRLRLLLLLLRWLRFLNVLCLLSMSFNQFCHFIFFLFPLSANLDWTLYSLLTIDVDWTNFEKYFPRWKNLRTRERNFTRISQDANKRLSKVNHEIDEKEMRSVVQEPPRWIIFKGVTNWKARTTLEKIRGNQRSSSVQSSWPWPWRETLLSSPLSLPFARSLARWWGEPSFYVTFIWLRQLDRRVRWTTSKCRWRCLTWFRNRMMSSAGNWVAAIDSNWRSNARIFSDWSSASLFQIRFIIISIAREKEGR